MILSRTGLSQAFAEEAFDCDPWDGTQLNPASYDLTLGAEVVVYCRPGADRSREGRVEVSGKQLPLPPYALDTRSNNPSFHVRTTATEGFRIEPGRIYLMATVERVRLGLELVGVVDGKSSLGRLGLVVHATAGYIDPGFDGHITLELAALGEPVIVYPGMRIAQLRLMRLEGKLDPAHGYQAHGHYVGQASTGPVPSRSYLQFQNSPRTEPSPPPQLLCDACRGTGAEDNTGFDGYRPCRLCGGSGNG